MNEHLPPIDPMIREQLARRADGRVPEALLADVSATIEAVAMERPRRLRLGGLDAASWRSANVAAAACIALVAVMAAALVFVPRFTAPGAAGTRALTASELAALLSGPPLAVNTTLVASVTVDSRTDVCPMNRYPTLGVVESMDSQVCVMGADLTTFLGSDRVSAAKVTGMFAFRYLAPGYLGLLGELTLPSAGFAFQVTDDWPLGGNTFLVDGWLGAEELAESCVAPPTSGDVLLPTGNDCPFDNWLGTDATAPGIVADQTYVFRSEYPSYDPLALRGNARHVEAGGMRIVDSVDHAAPVHGVYVVRSVTEGCAGDSVSSSRGCGTWRVLAMVADVSLHAPISPATTAPTLPSGSYPTERALTTDELGRLLSGPPPALNSALVASVTIDPQPDACPMNSRPTYGVIHGLDPQVCVVGPIGDAGSVATGQNVFAFRYMAPGVLGLLGLITPASTSKLRFAVPDDWSRGGKTFLVDGWLGGDGLNVVCATTPMVGDALDPSGEDCPYNDWLSASSDRGTSVIVQAGGARLIDAIDPAAPVHATFVVRWGPEQCTREWASCTNWRVLARLSDLTMPAEPTPTTAPPASPIPPAASPSASSAIAAGSVGVIGSGNTAISVDELETLMVTDPAHLAGRIAIVQAPIPTQISCQTEAGGGGCAVNTRVIAAEGIWAVRIGTDGTLVLAGKILVPQRGLVFTLDLLATTNLSGELLLVDAWLDWEPSLACDTPPYPSGSECAGGAVWSVLTSAPLTVQPAGYPDMQSPPPGVTAVTVAIGDYQRFGSSDLGARPIHAIYLLSGTTILARLETTVTP